MRECDVCGDKHYALYLCRYHYRQLPHIKKYMRDYMKKYDKRKKME